MLQCQRVGPCRWRPLEMSASAVLSDSYGTGGPSEKGPKAVFASPITNAKATSRRRCLYHQGDRSCGQSVNAGR
jgi:hypothetical protein